MTEERLKEIEARHAAATKGPWFWRINLKSKEVHLESHNRDGWLETVMDFVRWGMGNAKPRFLQQEKSLMVDANELAAIIPKREHHKDWAQTLDHPDANAIAHSWQDIGDLLAEVKRLQQLENYVDHLDECAWEHAAYGQDAVCSCGLDALEKAGTP